jgi:hypothetical protein
MVRSEAPAERLESRDDHNTKKAGGVSPAGFSAFSPTCPGERKAKCALRW